MTSEVRAALCYNGFVDGIDISQVQTISSFQAVADAGFVFVTAKASEGVGYCDPKVHEFLKGFRDVGMIANVYAFLRPSQGHARDQVKKALDCAGDVFPGRLALDLESAPEAMSAAELVAFGEECVEEALQNGVLVPELYSFPDFVKRRLLPALASSALLAQCPYWAAHYMSNTKPWLPPTGFTPYFPSPPFTKWTKHQYSANGGYRVPGIVGDVDRNLFNGDLHTFRDYMGLPDERETPQMMIVHPPVYGWRDDDEEPPPDDAA